MLWIVGAICLDIVAVRPRFREGTSNPSSVSVRLGGVGYNIYRGCRVPARFITAIGTDYLSRAARAALEGDPAVTMRECPGAGPSLYMAFMENGKLRLGASSLPAVETGLDPAFVLEQSQNAEAGDIIVLDGNLSAGVVEDVARSLAGRALTVFEPVSVEKADRHREALRQCWLATPSEDEAAALVRGAREGEDTGAGADLADAEVFSYMEGMGMETMLVKRGGRGVSLYRKGTRRDYPPSRRLEVKDTTGAGDLLLSSVLGYLQGGRELPEAIRPAMDDVERALEKGIE